MTQIVRYTGQTTFRYPNIGLEVSPQDPLHEVSDEMAQLLVDDYEFELYSGSEANVPSTLLSTFVDGEDINPTSIGKDTPADAVNAGEIRSKLEHDTVVIANQSDYVSGGSGVVDDPWLLDLDGLMKSLQGEWAAIFFPPGLYEVQGRVDVIETLGPYVHELQGEYSVRPPALIGMAKERSQLIMADGVDDDLFRVQQTLDTDCKIDGWRIQNLYFNGNKDAQNPPNADGELAGHNFMISDQGSKSFSRLKLNNVAVRWFQGDGFRITGRFTWNTSQFNRLDVKYMGGQGWEVPQDATVFDSNFSDNAKNGVVFRGENSDGISLKTANNGERGVFCQSAGCHIFGVWTRDNGQNASQPHVGGASTGDNNQIYAVYVDSTGADGASQAFGFGGEDNDLWGYYIAGSLGFGDMGTRGTANGVGLNNGDPTAGNGDWGGNGREGVSVVDTSSGTKYTYRGGSWY